jgi:hypothetical protein
MIIHHHLGLGDHFVCNGLVNFIAKHSQEQIDLICKDHNTPTINYLYQENPMVNVIGLKINNYNEINIVNNYAEQTNQKVLRIGFQHTDPKNWDRSFYKQLGIDFLERYRFFKLPRAKPSGILPVPIEKFIFVHNKSSDQDFNLNVQSNLYRIVVKKEDTNNLLCYLDLIEKAEEIHCINSSLFHLIDSLPSITNKLFYHNIRQHPCNFEISKKWSIIHYDSFCY